MSKLVKGCGLGSRLQNFDYVRISFLLSQLFYPSLLILREIEFHLIINLRRFPLLNRKAFEFFRLNKSAVQVNRKLNNLVSLILLGVILQRVILGTKNISLMYLLLNLVEVLLSIGWLV